MQFLTFGFPTVMKNPAEVRPGGLSKSTQIVKEN